MAIKLQGASRTDAFNFSGNEIQSLATSPQLVRWEELDDAHVEYLARSIAQRGQESPVLVRRAANGKPELVAGRHRRAAILKINADPTQYGKPAEFSAPLRAVYSELSDEEAVQASFAENTGKPLTIMDLAKAASNFARFNWENARIASVLSTPHHPMSASRVSQLRALIRLPYSVQRALHAGDIPEAAARAMLRLELDAENMESFATALESDDMKASEIVSMANAKRRSEGKKIKRTMADLRRKLEEVETAKAVNLLAWLDGEVVEDDGVDEIFKESD